MKADNAGLTISGDSAEVLLQLGHVKRGIQGFGVDLVIGERSSGEVGVRGVEAGRGDAAGYLQQQSREEQSLYLKLQNALLHFTFTSDTCRVVLTSLL